MTVKEIMKTEVVTCTATDDLATAAQVMHDHRCGFMPVIDGRGAVAGVVTDRDVCLSAANEKHRAPDHIPVQRVMSHPVFSALPGENLKAALNTMALHQVRRLPVIDDQGHLKGVLSIDDIVLAPRRRGAPTASELVVALTKIVQARPIQPVAS